MKKWEYLTIERYRNLYYDEVSLCWTEDLWSGPEINLGKLGNEGWELICAVPINSILGKSYSGVTTMIRYFFKRPIEEPRKRRTSLKTPTR